MTNPLLRRMSDLQAAVVMLSGNPADGAKIRGHRFTRQPVGRGMLLGDSDGVEHIQLVHPFAHAHSASRTRFGEDNPS